MTMFKNTLSILALATVFVGIPFGGALVHAELPACIKSLNTLQQSSNDTNVYTAIFKEEGKIQLSISNNRFMVLDGVNKDKKGTWACNAAGVITLTLDPTIVTGGQPGGTFTPSNGQPGGTNVSSTQTDFAIPIKLKNPLKVNTIQEAIKLFMDAVVKIAIPFIVVFFIWSGISFILARGNPTDITKAKNMFWYTVIGTLLILGAWAITDAIVGTINSFAS